MKEELGFFWIKLPRRVVARFDVRKECVKKTGMTSNLPPWKNSESQNENMCVIQPRIG